MQEADKHVVCGRWVYAEPGWARIAGLAPSVVACAQEGDKVAHQILHGGAADLANTVQAAVGQLHMPPPFNLVLAGTMQQAVLNLLPHCMCNYLMFPCSRQMVQH